MKGKGTLALLLAKGKPEGEEEGGEEEEAGEGHDEAADEIFDAMATKDRPAFRAALKAYVEMCVADYKHDEE